MKKNQKISGVKSITKPNALTDNQWGALFEDVNHNLKFLAEGIFVLDAKIDRVEENLTNRLDVFERQTNENFKTLFSFKDETEKNFKTVFSFIDKTESFIDKTEKNFKTVFEYLSRIDDELGDIKHEIKELKETRSAEIVRVVSLENRVKSLESELIFLRTRIPA